jgi:hypothetical protein
MNSQKLLSQNKVNLGLKAQSSCSKTAVSLKIPMSCYSGVEADSAAQEPLK